MRARTVPIDNEHDPKWSVHSSKRSIFTKHKKKSAAPTTELSHSEEAITTPHSTVKSRILAEVLFSTGVRTPECLVMLIYILFSLKPTVSVRILSTTDLSSWFKLKLPEQFYIQISFETKERGSAKEKQNYTLFLSPWIGGLNVRVGYSASLRTENERTTARCVWKHYNEKKNKCHQFCNPPPERYGIIASPSWIWNFFIKRNSYSDLKI